MVGSKKGNPRKQGKEQFYTIPAVADMFTEVLINKVGKNETWLEPSGGSGSFVDALLSRGISESHIFSFDIEPKHPQVRLQDFLDPTWEVPSAVSVAIGNPPFGRACALAIKFFNKCAEACHTIGFIIPPSFNKPSIQDQLNPFFHQLEVIDCPAISYFGEQGIHEGGLLRTQFQIWGKKSFIRKKVQHYRSDLFSFVKEQKDADLAFRTHGNGAGRLLDIKQENWNFRTTAFIKVIDSRTEQLLRSADFSYFLNSTSHIPCLAPAEISICVDALVSGNTVPSFRNWLPL